MWSLGTKKGSRVEACSGPKYVRAPPRTSRGSSGASCGDWTGLRIRIFLWAVWKLHQKEKAPTETHHEAELVFILTSLFDRSVWTTSVRPDALQTSRSGVRLWRIKYKSSFYLHNLLNAEIEVVNRSSDIRMKEDKQMSAHLHLYILHLTASSTPSAQLCVLPSVKTDVLTDFTEIHTNVVFLY